MTDAASPAHVRRQAAERRNLLVRVALALCVATPAFFAAAALGVKYQLFGWEFGFGVLTLRVLPALALAAAVAVLGALVLVMLARPARLWRLLGLSALAPLAVLIVWGGLATRALRSAPIHDVSTDLENPPRFSPLVIAERAMTRGGDVLDDPRGARVPAAFSGAAAGLKVSAVQQAAYPDLKPIATGADPGRALAAALGAAQRLGWMVDRVDAQAGVIEARDIGFWYGVVADIAIRVSPANPGSVVDLRAASRVGLSDLGANAARVRAFQAALMRELGA